MARQIAVIAPGAVGSVLGGLISKGGERVWSIDQWPEHVQALKANGLRISLGGRRHEGDLVHLVGDYRVPVRGFHVYQVCTLGIRFDVVFLASKAYDARWLARLIEPHLKADGYVVGLQGGDDDEAVARIVGKSRFVGCVYGGAAWLVEPDVAWQSTQPGMADTYVVGELNGSDTPRARDLAAMLEVAGPSRVTTNLSGARWTRLIYDTMTAGLSAVTGLEAHEAVGDAAFEAAAVALGREAIAVGAATGRAPEPLFGLSAGELVGQPDDVALRIMRAGAGYAGPGHISSVRQDTQRGRLTEVGDHLNGLVAGYGRAAGIAVPLNEQLVALHDRVVRGEMTPDRSVLATLG